MTLRRITRLSVSIVMGLALVLSVSGPASGGPDCDRVPNNPLCQEPGPLPDHPDGGTCEASGDPWIAATDAFTVTLADKLTCVDWTTTKAATWKITATLNGAKSFNAHIRDSHPGDFCWRADGSFEETVIPPLPIAGIDACGTEYTDLADPAEAAIPYALSLFYKGKSSGVVVTVEEVD